MIRQIVLLACVIFTCNLIDALNIVSRSEWGAKPASRPYRNLKAAADYVVIHHSASSTCTSITDCSSKLKSFQNEHMRKGWRDIGYNFLVSEEGNVYEGQGWGRSGTHAGNLNYKSIGICLIGTYTNSAPNQAALSAVKELIADGVSKGKIATNYKLVGHRQVKATECPGTSLYNVLKTWPKYSSAL